MLQKIEYIYAVNKKKKTLKISKEFQGINRKEVLLGISQERYLIALKQ